MQKRHTILAIRYDIKILRPLYSSRRQLVNLLKAVSLITLLLYYVSWEYLLVCDILFSFNWIGSWRSMMVINVVEIMSPITELIVQIAWALHLILLILLPCILVILNNVWFWRHWQGFHTFIHDIGRPHHPFILRLWLPRLHINDIGLFWLQQIDIGFLLFDFVYMNTVR